ncbi:MAG: type I polyketide synthase, partial [Leptospiraceae bacterium]|nr:type I polyketide synthase [Leptospiraceae bacterium]
NQDGASNGLMAPNGLSQQSVIRAACNNAGVKPESIQYAECHGTGTSLGDPIEARALGQTYGQARFTDSLRIGSVKSNIGHCEAAAGVAGLIKLSLMIHRKKLYATANFNRPNPGIDLDGWRLRVQSETETWENTEGVLRGSVSSFGFGGTNAHLILESPSGKAAVKLPNAEGANGPSTAGMVRPDLDSGISPNLLLLSARSQQSLANRARDLLNYVAARPMVNLADLCYLIAKKRDIHKYKVSIVFQSRQELILQLEQIVNGEDLPANAQSGYSSSTSRKGIVLVYPGQGQLEQGMGSKLYASESVFRQTIDEIRPFYLDLTGADIIHSIRGPSHKSSYRMDLMQGGLFALQAGLTQLWKSLGLEPGAAVGHSLGEVTAAWATGALDLESALKVVALRSRIQQKEGGAGLMAAVAIKPQEFQSIQGALEITDVEIAAVNGPESLV